MNYSKKKIRRKLHNGFLKVFTGLNGISLLLLACAVDSFTSLIPFGIMLFNMLWLFLMAYANGWMYDTEPYYEREMKKNDQM